MAAFVVTLSVVVLAWALLSRRIQRISITGPIVLVLAGALLGNGPWAVVDLSPRSETARVLAELTLALVLFCDASRVQATRLATERWVSLRLLGVGLPLTMAVGFVTGAVLFPDRDLWVVALVAAALSPTDAALGASIMSDARVPAFIRRTVNVESGLNDGIATPFVLFFLAAATADETDASVPDAVVGAVLAFALAVVLGAVVGGAGARLIAASRARDWAEPSAVPLAATALAVLSYALSVSVGGNGFVAAFVAGIAFGNSLSDQGQPELEFAEDLGALMSLSVWFVFGAAVVVPALGHLTPAVAVYALLSLTLVRMVPVALSLVRSGVDRPSTLAIGWLGPRGLASIVFALIAVDELDPLADAWVATVVAVTVLGSVLAHGLSAGPVAARLARLGAKEEESGPVTRPRRLAPWTSG